MTAAGNDQAVVIGAGVAGLAVAIRLAVKGYRVTVFEANEAPGGKMGELHLAGYRFDTGPSLLTMPHLLDELIREAGRAPRDYIRYERLSTACQYVFPDGTWLNAFADPEAFADEAEAKLGVPRRRLLRYLEASRRAYEVAGELFLAHSLHDPRTYARWPTWKAALLAPTLDLLSSLHATNQRRLREPHLVQLFDRFATYNGSDPYRAPGILRMIPYLEHGLGGAYPEGGMYAVARGLHRLAEELGVAFHFRAPVERILHADGRVQGVQAGGEAVPAKVVVSNADIVRTYRHLLPDLTPPRAVLRQERSSSALLFYWGMAGQFPELDLHNIFFSAAYRAEFQDLFARKRLPADPTIYVNITAKRTPADAPAGHENWFVMLNAPAAPELDWPALIGEAREQVLGKLGKALGRDLRPFIAAEATLSPAGLQAQTAAHLGALYGTSSNHRLAAFFRHPNASRRVRGLYFCGGSVHPGGGIPLCLNSAKIAGELVPDPAASSP